MSESVQGMPAITTGGITQAIKRRLWRGVKVLGLYALWRGGAVMCAMLVFGTIGLGVLKTNYVTPLPATRDLLSPLISTPRKTLQTHTYAFLYGRPYLWPIWGRIPPFNFQNPLTLLTDGWVL